MVKIDLATNEAVQTIVFDDQVAPQGSSLNDTGIAWWTRSFERGAMGQSED